MLSRLRSLLKERTSPKSICLPPGIEHEPEASYLRAMKERGKRYEENSGVSLKEGVEDNDEIDWNEPFSPADYAEAARRCLAKHRQTDPNDLNPAKLRYLLSQVKGYQADISLIESQLHAIIQEWRSLHEKELEKVTFDNVASYEP